MGIGKEELKVLEHYGYKQILIQKNPNIYGIYAHPNSNTYREISQAVKSLAEFVEHRIFNTDEGRCFRGFLAFEQDGKYYNGVCITVNWVKFVTKTDHRFEITINPTNKTKPQILDFMSRVE